jgi:hypothetical protein
MEIPGVTGLVGSSPSCSAAAFQSEDLQATRKMLHWISWYDYEMWRLPSGKRLQVAIENGHWNSEFSHEKWWFSIAMLVTRG